MLRPFALALALLPGTLAAAPRASAQSSYEGRWRQGGLRVRVAIQEWGTDCGSRPESRSVPGGSAIRISQQGEHLTFHQRRSRSTRSCWSENSSVRRVSSSVQNGVWRIVCRTPASDSRAEVGHYTIRASGADRLEFVDRSQYDWQLNESRCRATITTEQSFTRIAEAPTAEAPDAGPREAPPPERAACTPGAAARLGLRRPPDVLGPGERFCFRPRAYDAEGCPLRRRPRLRLRAGSPGRVEGACYVAAGEGRAVLEAQLGSLRESRTVEVRSLDLSDLIARRMERAETDDDESEGTGPAARIRTVPRAREEGASPIGWWALASGLGLLLLGALLLLLRRSARATVRADPMGPTDVPRGAPATPAPAEDLVPSIAAPPGEGDWVCPTCRRGYVPGTETCPRDGDRPLPYADFVAAQSRSAGQEKICPECGTRYPAQVAFCGKDGVTLVDATSTPSGPASGSS